MRIHDAIRIAVAVFAILPAGALAAGGHDSVGCTGCHSIHDAKGRLLFAVAPNTRHLNPRTNQPYGGTTALCLGCHQDTDKGGKGYLPVSKHIPHPFFVASPNPRVARVPAQLLREGRFECISCHDPHPSNPNAKYLRVDVGGKKERLLDRFCGVCHGGKADPSVANAPLFSSMDETAPRPAARPR